jgi:HAD superfamily hydrolase (TIGR01450 family)
VQLRDVEGFVLDIDGTLVHRDGERVVVEPGARELLERIRGSGRRFVLFTNGSHAPPETFAAGLRAVGLAVEDRDVLTPLVSVQLYLRARHRGGSVLLFADDPARDYLARAGVRILDREGDPAAVFVAHADAVDFPRLERAARAVLAGARLLTASYAPAYAGANGPIFSRGAMTAAAISKATGARPVIVGKPSRAAVRAVTERLGLPSHRLVVIGDDVGMDIALGKLGGSRTILVRSGISGAAGLERVHASRRPDAVVDGAAELLEWL